ncbi:secA translation cis-regulator SecM [Mannheimia sp. AT1]|uniref:SecA translation cis-regulator SecM n=1 Tax=Mannheimia cairinae TaxID=3025936 RepID=A0ABT5MNQ8_9PAST|nr:secA translation cis-regulator SecM [Mannheimia cairinae]MDD0823637.1 secA translation cis-regulator SecM [Mannheimia cairinae]MDD0825431.1 secA translation cis-regulator SecM [Mannheimia cairinae]
MNLFFKHFHKTPFWSQLLLGMVAMLALPEIQAINPNENEQESVINQSLVQYAQTAIDVEQQALFIVALNDTPIKGKSQAVSFCEFFANYYRLDNCNLNPIRAGPIA